MRRKISALLIAGALMSAGSAHAFKNPVMLEAQGSFTAGGITITRSGDFTSPLSEAGQTIHGDHAYVFWQRPVNARKYPLVFLHGAGSSGQVWETTPDGRDGYQNIFLERGYSTYIIDQPRRGRAGKATVDGSIKAFASEQTSFNVGRLGIWPDTFPDVQVSFDAEAWEQHFRNSTPNTGAFDAEVISDAVAKVFERSGEAVLVTHSQGGGVGWLVVMKSPKVKAVVSYEPGSGFVFPEGEVPETMESTSPFGALSGEAVPLEEFLKLTRIPILIFYGGNIPEEITQEWGRDNWRVRLKMARLWVDAVNRHGGDAKLIHLPSLGINGNTHSLFADLNNEQLADIQEQWMHEKNLDVK